MTYQERFGKLIQRMRNNDERYRSLFGSAKTPTEKKIKELCDYFHGSNTNNKLGYSVRDDLMPSIADKELNELEALLDEDGWE